LLLADAGPEVGEKAKTLGAPPVAMRAAVPAHRDAEKRRNFLC
jgi:hypothetical protein